MPLKFADALAFDFDGKPLHKGDLCFRAIKEENEPENGYNVEILNIIPQNMASIIMPDGTVEVCSTVELKFVDRTREEPESFESPTIENPDKAQGTVKLLTPNDLIINEVANVLLKVMKSASKVVRPLQYKVDKVTRQRLAEDGRVMQGHVDCQVQVQDNGSARRGTMNLRLAITDGVVQLPTTFQVATGEFQLTAEGFKSWLDISAKPYYSKKPTSVVRSNRDTY